MRVTLLLFALLSLPGLALPGLAQAGEDRVELKNVAARVIVIAQPRADVDVRVKAGTRAMPQVTVARQNNVVRINGNVSPRNQSCGETTNIFAFNFADKNVTTVKVSGMGQVNLGDLPVIYIYAPENLEIVSHGAVYGSLNETSSLKLSVHGCGDWRLGPVRGDLKLMSTGSGNIHGPNAGRTEIVSGGSGDIIMGPVRSLKVSQSGSGDIVTGPVAEGLSAAQAGSGDMAIASVNGPIEVSLAGSGDVTIARGRAQTLKIAIAGSGDVHFGGEAHAVEAAIVGSGDIYVARSTGSVQKKVLGSGEVSIGGR
ncbi:DUF2807 domain-containing protein [Asticcacaulis sp. BYS171W]|uniref:DUF2807 domain-containing protein n=1 Tax=Asticcacaulis aquaticus TaxID=2984212 RepID=A0ABT5HQS1_9CAUL|nr:DUF2807 domain-containing protein [Asticcacaulis aquaticus]MDC7682420.1 DUF2807 domain-containing protein [Asticcacaulis aquaticus]